MGEGRTAEPMRRPVLERVDRAELAAVAGEWDALVARSHAPGVFLSWAWVSAWLDTLGAEADLEIVVARDAADGRLVGAAPFFVERRTRAGIRHRVLRIVGSGPAAPDHLDMPVAVDAPAATAPALWEHLQRERRWDLIDLDGVASGGIIDRLALRRSGDREGAERIAAPYLPLANTWEETARRFGAGHRQNIGRYRRKLDREAGAAVKEWMVADRAAITETITRLGDLHQQVQVAAGHRGAFATPAMRSFHETVAHRMHDAGRLRLWRLDVDDDPIAVIECFRFGGVVAFYTTGYDPAWARFGPGRRIMAAAIAGAIDEGADEFDFLRGDESYKESWGTDIRHDLRIIRPAGSRGRLLWQGRKLLRGVTTGRASG